MSDVKLLLGDCLEIMPTLTERIDVCITDPPYGIAKVWKGGNGHGWAVARLATAERNEWDILPDKTTFEIILSMCNKSIIWGGNYFDLPISRGWLVWNKPERGFSLAEAELAWTSESFPIRVFDCHRSDSDRVHPTQKPVSLMAWCINLFSKPGDTILDPFMGSGTTGVACVNLGRNFIGIEKDEGYFKIAERRIMNAQEPLFVE